MSMRRPLALLFALCFILSSPFSAAYAVDAKSIDELGIDPWGDLQQMQQGQISTVQDPAELELADDPVYSVSYDAEIMPMAILDEITYGIYLTGFKPTQNVDQDGDLWDAFGVDFSNGPVGLFNPNLNNSLTSAANVGKGSFQGLESLNTGLAAGNLRSSYAVQIPISQRTNYIGRPGWISGQPQVTVMSKLAASSGQIHVPITSFTPTESVESVALNDFVFSLSPAYCYWEYHDSAVDKRGAYIYAEAAFNGAFLYVNGVEKARLLTSHTGTPGVSGGKYRLEISNDTIAFDTKTYVEDIEIVLDFRLPAVNKYYDCNGGFGVQIVGNVGFAASNAKLIVEADTSSENTGLLKGIIEFLQKIVNGISSIGSAIAALPGQIANLVIEGIKSLFVPSEEDFANLKDQYQDLLAERLGFIWQAGEWITSFGSELLSALSGGAEAEFKFPGVGFDMAGAHYQLIEEQAVDFGSNGIVVVIRPFIGTIVSIVVVGACVNLFHDMVTALISGKSYFDFLKGDGST